MSKIVQAVNAMISRSDLITDVYKGEYETECFFKYDGKHNWSIGEGSNSFFISYYPGESVDLKELASIPNDHWDNAAPRNISYNTQTIGTKEATESFSELLNIVNEKIHGMDSILDDIINSDDMPF